MKIGIGNDHTALVLKKEIVDYLQQRGLEVIDYGTQTTDSVDYPVIAQEVAGAIGREIDRAILICGTGVGMSIAANKVRGIRAAVCSDPFSAKMAKEHNDAQILCFGARVVGSELAKMIVASWLEATYQAGRHDRRIEQIATIEGNKK